MGVRAIGYGIDPDSRPIRVVRCEVRRWKRADCRTLAIAAESSESAAGDLRRRLHDEQRAHRAWIAAALTAGDYVVRRLRIPLPPSRAQRVLRAVLNAQTPFPMDACECQSAEVLRIGRDETEILAVVAPHAAIDQRLEELRAAGWDPAFLVPDALALWRESLAERPASSPGEGRLVVWAGERWWSVAAGVGDRLQWSISLEAPQREAASQLMDACETIWRRWRVDPAASDGAICWCWCGDALSPPEVRAETERQLKSRSPIEFVEHEKAGAFLARALARIAAVRAAGVVQLRAGDRGQADWRRFEEVCAARRLRQVAAAASVLLVLNGAAVIGARRADALWQTRIRELASDLAPGARLPYGQELTVARSAVERRRGELEPFLRMSDPVVRATLGSILRTASATEITIHELQISGQRLMVAGRSDGDDGAHVGLQRALEGLGWRLEPPAVAGRTFVLRGGRL